MFGVDRVSNRTALNELPAVEAIHMRMPAINVVIKTWKRKQELVGSISEHSSVDGAYDTHGEGYI